MQHDDAIVDLCLALFAEDPGPRTMVREEVLRTLDRLRREPVRGMAVVLELDGLIVGYALLISFWSNELAGELCTVDELYVRPSHRNRGHGSALLCDLAAGQGPWPRVAIAIALEVTLGNTRAWNLYQRLGFKGGNRVMRKTLSLSST